MVLAFCVCQLTITFWPASTVVGVIVRVAVGFVGVGLGAGTGTLGVELGVCPGVSLFWPLNPMQPAITNTGIKIRTRQIPRTTLEPISPPNADCVLANSDGAAVQEVACTLPPGPDWCQFFVSCPWQGVPG